MTEEQIQEIALANGFKLKPQPDGMMALNPYVFDFARALLFEAGLPPRPEPGEFVDQPHLSRWGIEWQGPQNPICVPMGDGYWTSWHIAEKALSDKQQEIEALLDDAAFALRSQGESYEKKIVEQKAEVERLRKGWKPIETAPKDSSAILVMRDIWPGNPSGRAKKCNGHNTYVAEWWEGENNGKGAWICYMDATHDPICPIEPTHWMPLPLPPMKEEI